MSEPAVHGAHCFVVACHPTGCTSTVVASHPCVLQTGSFRRCRI